MSAADAASEQDRVWFLRHPRRTVYVRPFVPGEVPASMPRGDGVPVTIVRQIGGGVRVRVPVYLPAMPPNTEAHAERLLRAAMEARS